MTGTQLSRITMACLVAFSLPGYACNVPVFRYALERWPAANYEVVLFHRGPLNPAEQAARALLEQAAQRTANLALSRRPSHAVGFVIAHGLLRPAPGASRPG